MHPPDELMIDTFLPSMRQLVAHRLRSEGHSQKSISSLMGVTQASVSMYLSSDPVRAYSNLASLSLSSEEADRYATLLAEDLKRDPVDAQSTLDSVWKGIIGNGRACTLHRGRYPSLEDCDICMKGFSGGSARPDAVSEVALAVGALQRSTNFASVMPEVSVNLAYAPDDAKSIEDVVAVPGRIVKVMGRATSLMKPEFGASGHVARVLLLVRSKKKKTKACLNLRYDSKMEAALRKLGLKVLKVGGHSARGRPDPTVEALRSRLAEGENFDAVADIGGGGTEPNVYLLGDSPGTVAKLAIRVSDVYSSG